MPDQTPRPESRTRARAVLDALLPGVRTRAVDALGPVEGEGLVASRPHPSDQRTALFELTAAGHEVMSQLYQGQMVWSFEVLKKIDGEKLRRVIVLMDEVAAVLAQTPPLP